MEERYLNFNHFVKQRAIQITKFTQSLQSSTAKRTHQSLPKSIRRRAMSHNRYRIPLRMRRLLGQELVKAESMQRIPKCRKSIRKQHRLMLSYKSRNGKAKWLNTHLWASKRMRMRIYCGYKIAQTPNNKSFRSAYRHFRHNSCLLDCSYFHSLTIRCKQSDLQCKLPPQLQLKTPLEQKYQMFYQGSLVDHQNGAQFICPLLIFFESSHVIRCIFDPFCLQEVQEINWATETYDVQISKNKTEIYLLLGPESLKRAQQAITSLGMTSPLGRDQLNLQTANQKILYFTSAKKAQTQETPRHSLQSKPIAERLAEGYDKSESKKMREMFFAAYNSSRQRKQKQQHVQANQSFWKFYQNVSSQIQNNEKENENLVMKVTTRSKYTHKRKNKLSRQQKKRNVAEEGIKNNPDKLLREKQAVISPGLLVEGICSSHVKKQNPHQDSVKGLTSISKTEEQGPILVAPFINLKSKQQMFQGCFIFCSAGDSCKIWRTITSTNVKVIGRKQLRHLYFQASVRFYPDDFCESASFKKYNKSRAMDLIDRNRAVPPQKRVNFAKLNSPFPFCFFLPGEKAQTKQIKIQMVSRGKCAVGSYIFSLEREDYDTISKSIEMQGRVKSVVCEQKIVEKAQNGEKQAAYDSTTCGSYEQMINSLRISSSRMRRKMIGFVTCGGFKNSDSKQGGIGYLFEPAGSQGTDCQQYVLVRKVTSRFYYLGITTQID